MDENQSVTIEKHECCLCNYQTFRKCTCNSFRHGKCHADKSIAQPKTRTAKVATRRAAICDQCGWHFTLRFGLRLQDKNIYVKEYKLSCAQYGKGYNQTVQYQSHCANQLTLSLSELTFAILLSGVIHLWGVISWCGHSTMKNNNLLNSSVRNATSSSALKVFGYPLKRYALT